MSLRFLADNDLRKHILRGVLRREPGIDFLSAQEAQLDGLPDLVVLAYAAQEGRILVSHDFSTMPAHFREFCHTQDSPGVLIIQQSCSLEVAITSLIFTWAAGRPEDFHNRAQLLPDYELLASGSA